MTTNVRARAENFFLFGRMSYVAWLLCLKIMIHKGLRVRGCEKMKQRLKSEAFRGYFRLLGLKNLIIFSEPQWWDQTPTDDM
jgi:hypothetical protein